MLPHASLSAYLYAECWFFDQEPIAQRSVHQSLSAQYTALKLAPPHGPQVWGLVRCDCENGEGGS